ncbi:MAG TPA: MraY family glycosyltransferase [Patescibacteria group bacterium]
MLFLIPFLISAIVSLIVTPLVAKLAYNFKFVDNPKTHKHPAIIHRQTLARAGGVALWISIISAIFFTVDIDKKVLGIIMAGTLTLIVGTLDDKYEISPYVRFLFNILTGLTLVIFGVGIDAITNPFGGIIQLDLYRINLLGQDLSVLKSIFTILWTVWVMNMLNWSKGVDGQMPGVVFVAAVVLAIVSFKFLPNDPTQIVPAKLSLITAGATLGFLFYNFYPAKILPGYGATVLGLMLAAISILSAGKIATAILVLAVPMADGVFTIIRRLSLRRSPFWGDREHLHHLLLDLGWNQRQIALFYATCCAILGTIALNLKSLGKLFALSLIFTLIFGSILWLRLFLKTKTSQD